MLAFPPDDTALQTFETLRRYILEAGRDPDRHGPGQVLEQAAVRARPAQAMSEGDLHVAGVTDDGVVVVGGGLQKAQDGHLQGRAPVVPGALVHEGPEVVADIVAWLRQEIG